MVQYSHFVWSLFNFFFYFYFLKENQAACLTGKAGGKTGWFVGQVELGEEDGLNVKLKSFKSLPCEGS